MDAGVRAGKAIANERPSTRPTSTLIGFAREWLIEQRKACGCVAGGRSRQREGEQQRTRSGKELLDLVIHGGALAAYGGAAGPPSYRRIPDPMASDWPIGVFASVNSRGKSRIRTRSIAFMNLAAISVSHRGNVAVPQLLGSGPRADPPGAGLGPCFPPWPPFANQAQRPPPQTSPRASALWSSHPPIRRRIGEFGRTRSRARRSTAPPRGAPHASGAATRPCPR
eukprot:COSAG06_NODE_1102_length_10694_cov_5.964417_2_plen_225_part_00